MVLIKTADHLDCVALAVIAVIADIGLVADLGYILEALVGLVAVLAVVDNSAVVLAVLLVAGSFVVVPDPVNYRIQ
jgi:hypothetical protein